MLAIVKERRNRGGRPRKADDDKLGAGRFVRFSLKQEAAIEAMRHRIEQEVRAAGDLTTQVEVSEAIRRLVQQGAQVEGLFMVDH